MEGKAERRIKHYISGHKILLIGEGDFSFSVCLAKAFGSGRNMVATSLDSKEELLVKHKTSVAHVSELRRLSCLVLHGVDVGCMLVRERLVKRGKFDRIVYNFPHAGYQMGLGECSPALIKRHKELLTSFFRSARELIADGGQIHVTHRDDRPYRNWDLVRLASDAGLCLVRKAEFSKEDYPGYHNKKGSGANSNKTFRLNEAYTFMFEKDKEVVSYDTISRERILSGSKWIWRKCEPSKISNLLKL